MNRTIEISSGTILRTIFILMFLWFLYAIRDIVLLLFIALIIVSAIDPIVDKLQRKKIPRSLTVIVLYIFLFALFGFVVFLLIPPLTSEIQGLSQSFPQLVEKLSGYFQNVRDFAAAHNFEQNVTNFLTTVASRVSQAGENVFTGTITFLGGILEFLIVLSIAFYMTVQEKGTKKFFAALIPSDHKEYVMRFVERIEYKMGRWLQGQLLLMFLVFGLDYLGLLVIGAPYALILALIAGILEIIPYIGPIISAVVAVAVSFLHGPATGLLVLALFTAVQQLEGYVLTPLVMKKAVGLNPVVVIVALLVGAKLAGAIGVIVSVPIATVIGEVVNDLVRKPETNEEKSEL
jgi:predicted PurR-regulated permease PerM